MLTSTIVSFIENYYKYFVNSNISTLFNMDPYTIVKNEGLEIYDEFAKVGQEITDNCYTFQVPKEETDVQEGIKFNPETILPDKFTVGLSTTHCRSLTLHVKNHSNLKNFRSHICEFST